MNPTLDGFLAFVYQQGVPTSAIADDTNPYLIGAYNEAVEIVIQLLATISPILYTTAVYNLAMHVLVENAQDAAGQTYFQTLRQKLGLNGGIFGVVTTSSDEGTSVSVEAPDFVKNLSLADLSYLKDPWGRKYVEIAQRAGLSWGLN